MKKNGKKTVVAASEWIPDELFQAIQKNVPVPCVDLLVVRKGPRGLETLLVKRKIYPEEGAWCLIGGRILKGETTMSAIRRQAKRELGVSVRILTPWSDSSPFAVYNEPFVDEQKHAIVLTYAVSILKGTIKKTGPEFSEARWFPLAKLPARVGFHHRKVIEDFRKIASRLALTA